MKKQINFDTFARGMIVIASLFALYYTLSYLSPVLLPFFVAWVFAYMLYPIVVFLEKKCRIRNRALSILCTILLLGGFITALGYFIVPPFLEEYAKIKSAAISYLTNDGEHVNSVPQQIQNFIRDYASSNNLDELLRQEDIQNAIKKMVPKAWDMIWTTAGSIISVLSSLIGLIYFFFLLRDYEKYAKGWINFIPRKNRKLAAQIVGDIENGMNGYFRGQALVALSNCVMFSIGFVIIGFPTPIALGCFIGIISFIPYIQVVGIIPAAVLALLQAYEQGTNFWWIMALVLLVYVVVQIIQDSVVTPYVMGKVMGLSPAIILLALTVWGYMLGIIGLIIALPLTTLLVSYYKRYVIGDSQTQIETPK